MIDFRFRHHAFVLIALCALLMLFTGCSNMPIPGSGPSKTVPKMTGDIVLSFDENPSTGFEWSYWVEPEGALEVTGDRYLSDDPDSDACGVGGTHYWSFNALQDGSITLHFLEHRGTELISEGFYEYDVRDGVVTLTNEPFSWTCAYCGHENHDRSWQTCTECYKAMSGFADGWICECGRLNTLDTNVCDLCALFDCSECELYGPYEGANTYVCGWVCPCGERVYDDALCPECETVRPDYQNGWVCADCGATNPDALSCQECEAPRHEDSDFWICSCRQFNYTTTCTSCGNTRFV